MTTQNAELIWTPAHKLHQLIRTKQISPVELMQASLDRIDELNPTLNAFLAVMHDEALEGARLAEKAVMDGEEIGPLHGIPVSIKDLEAVAGVRQTNGCLVDKDFVPDTDSMAAERVRHAGAVIVGKTNTSEFGHIGTNENRLGDACRNPWDPACTSGASSGGAGASVGSGMTAIAQGSDGGGSIRIPSAFCGIYGIKASQGRVPRRSKGLDSWHPINTSCVGAMARDVRDAAILLQALAGPAPDAEFGTLQDEPPDFAAAFHRGVRGLRIAWSPDLGGVPVDPEVAAITKAAAEVFEGLGAHLEAPEFKMDDPQAVFDTFQVFYRTKAYATHGDLLREHPDELTDYFREGLELGSRLTSEELYDAYSTIMKYRSYVNEFFASFDLLLTPTTAVTSFPINEHPTSIGGRKVPHRLWGFTPFTYPFNMTGNPAATVPAGFAQNGMPVGLHIVGRFGDEEAVLAASAAFESTRPWAHLRPDPLKST